MNTGNETTQNEQVTRKEVLPEAASETVRSFNVFPLAVIELGTSAIRMAVGESDGNSNVRVLEQLVRGLSLGKDTFTQGEIQRKTLQETIRILKSYRRKLKEYQCTDPKHIRIVATSAVREASNRIEVLDRIYTATGLSVEMIDDAEIARVTYLGVRPLLQSDATLADGLTVVAEVGGGNTEVLVLKGKDIVHSQPYRLGSLRLQQMFMHSQTTRSRMGSIMTDQIDRTLEPLLDIVPKGRQVELVALGGDMRFAARVVGVELHASGLSRIAVDELEKLTSKLLLMTVDRIMRKHHLELSQAETLVPALLSNLRLARLLECSQILITGLNLRDALLQGMLRSNDWSTDFCDQVVNSATELARRYQVDLQHARHVARLARTLFRSLQSEHRMDARCETLLYVAALLHEIGLFVGVSGYHKHSHYLITHSELFGLNEQDQQLVAMIARYHRRAAPKPTHELFARLDRDNRVVVSRLAGILRVAVALDHTGSQRVHDIECTIERHRLVISVKNSAGDLSLERMELRQKSLLLEDTFGLSVLLREAPR
ncbi:MAG: Ppx/GppA family phosphatase [Planctomycetaceae bacterium]|nr:Ppx/GppA family phosphatase [Planctomycetaceae bacterium]